jgi:hypothetical protein
MRKYANCESVVKREAEVYEVGKVAEMYRIPGNQLAQPAPSLGVGGRILEGFAEHLDGYIGSQMECSLVPSLATIMQCSRRRCKNISQISEENPVQNS